MLKKNRAAADKTVAALAKVANQAPKLKVKPLAIKGPVPDFRPSYKSKTAGKAKIFQLEDTFCATGRCKKRLLSLATVLPFSTMAMLLTGKDSEGKPWDRKNAFDLRDYLIALGALRYVVVVRTTKLVHGEITVARLFKSGQYKADVLVFDLKGPVYLGGYTVTAKNSKEITSAKKAILDSDYAEMIKDDLASQALKQVKAGFKQRVPAAKW